MDALVVDAGPVVLREFAEHHLDAVREAMADPAVVLWNPGPDPGDRAATLAWMRERGDWSAGDHASWAVTDHDGALLGSVSVHRIDRAHRNAEIGYWTTPSARGRGVATLALDAAARFALHTLGLHRVQLLHAVANPASCRVAEKAGFLREGVLRGSYRYGDGLLHDEHLHARLATD